MTLELHTRRNRACKVNRTLHAHVVATCTAALTWALTLPGCTGAIGELGDEIPSHLGGGKHNDGSGGSSGASSAGTGGSAGAFAELDGGGVPQPPFEPTAPGAYLAKVKNLLTGLSPSDAELAAVTSDSGALAGLIDGWMETTEFRDKQLAFFRVAFQQGNLTNTSFDLIAHDGYGMGNRLPAYDNAMESFPRTAWDIVERGEPFTQVITTDTWMLTPALASVITWFDSRKIDDENNAHSVDGEQGQRYDVVHDGYPNGIDPLESYQMTPVMHWYTPCELTEPRFVDDTFFLDLNRYIWGEILSGPPGCRQPVLFEPSDFTTWRRVRLRQAEPGEMHTRFYDFQSLREDDELVLQSPRVGFFTTPAFFANWPTNDSNQGRVITNQTLIVAIGGALNPAEISVPLTTTSLSTEHADPKSVCYGCHKSLDPMRVFFRKTYSLYYGYQDDPEWTDLQPSFAFGGVTAAGDTIQDLAQILADHPAFAPSWVQRLCFYANSAGCDPKDPEFMRISEAFVASDFDYKTLVRELFSSPLVTGAARTETHVDGPVAPSITRSNHYCALLAARLGLADPCGLGLSILVQQESLAYQIANNIPGDTYSRGNVNSEPPTSPSLFTRAASEALCSYVAERVVDPDPPSNADDPPLMNRYPSSAPDAALLDMVHTLMALPSTDPREPDALAMLRRHYMEAAALDGIRPTDALRSAFILACTSPTVAGVGL